MKLNRTYAILAVIMTAIIWINSLMPASISGVQSGWVTAIVSTMLSFIGIDLNPDLLGIWIRKLAHFTEFFVLAILWFQAITHKIRPTVIHLSITMLLALVTALIDETIQRFVDGRSFQLIDIGVDLLGASFGIVIALWISQIIHQKTQVG